jgi:hypothetical protein
MTVSFEGTEEDAIEAVSYLNYNLPQFRSQKRALRFLAAILLVLAALMALLLLVKFSVFNLIMCVYCLAVGIAIPYSQKRGMRSLFRKMVKSGAAATLLGPQSYTPTPEGLATTSRFGRAVLYWSGIDKVVELETAVALHFSSAQAILIPKRAFASPAHGAEFLQLIEQYRQQTTGEPIPQTTKGSWWTQGNSVTDETLPLSSRQE